MPILRKIWNFPSQATVLLLAMGDRRTPVMSKFLMLLSLLYLISPVDFIPDFIPFAGWLDDLLIVPFLMMLSFRQLPEQVLTELQRRSQKQLLILKVILFTSLLALIAMLFLLVKSF